MSCCSPIALAIYEYDTLGDETSLDFDEGDIIEVWARLCLMHWWYIWSTFNICRLQRRVLMVGGRGVLETRLVAFRPVL